MWRNLFLSYKKKLSLLFLFKSGKTSTIGSLKKITNENIHPKCYGSDVVLPYSLRNISQKIFSSLLLLYGPNKEHYNTMGQNRRREGIGWGDGISGRHQYLGLWHGKPYVHGNVWGALGFVLGVQLHKNICWCKP